ncbi:uncharacterized protein LOC127291655 [Leptopilina boulardi]|uniref:uncharacterized protein LOC127291655 n=1 Tax=Leptopilina boulardi TaxID=63433 RepID=UPI0021F526A7|nr:uncharacterized protein LOC127291655 [Leptopilina boulardi]
MKLLFYLGLVTISFAICECLRCYNCYHGFKLSYDQIYELGNEHKIHTPNSDRCVINNGEITGPICETSNQCVDMIVDINEEKTVYHFCSNVEYPFEGNLIQVSGNEIMKVSYKHCLNDLCNGASSIFTITSLAFISVLSLLLLLLFS